MANRSETKARNDVVTFKAANRRKGKQLKQRNPQSSIKRMCWLHVNLELLQIDNVKKECVTQGWLDIAWQDHTLAKEMNHQQVSGDIVFTVCQLSLQEATDT